MGRSLQVEWQETELDLKQKYRQEKHRQRRERLFVLWHLRQGKRVEAVAQMTGIAYRVIQRWVAWYRYGGLGEVLRRVSGHGTQGVKAKLSALQQKALVARVRLGDFATVWQVLAWVEARWGIVYSYEGMRSVLKRQRLALKVPRPQAEKAQVQAQSAWQKKGWSTP
jgi:transposase